MKRTITCPHCGDTWEYNMIVDHKTNKCVVTKDWAFLEEGQICQCLKCNNNYIIKIDQPADEVMEDFIYKAWKNCKF